MSCHGWTGVSPIIGYATLTGARAVNDPTATNVAQVVISGARRTAGGGAFMPAFGQAYSDDEIAAVANYVTARFGAELVSASRQRRGEVAGKPVTAVLRVGRGRRNDRAFVSAWRGGAMGRTGYQGG